MLSPEFRRSMACGEAKRIWKRYGFTTPTELVLEDLAMVMGVVVLEDRLDSADARLVRKGHQGIIRVNGQLAQAGRKRFAIAHELGHWCLHDKLTQLLACTSEDMRAHEYARGEPEVEANWFAAELLMPESLFASRIKGTTPAPTVIDSLAAEFGVSRTAAAVRYVELTRDYCAIVVCEDGRMRWWRASARFEGDLWINAGSKVSALTLAGKHFNGTTVSEPVQSVGISEWAERWPEYADEAIEGLLPLGSSGVALTLLWLP